MLAHDVPGYEHVLNAASLIKAAVDDLFSIPKAAQDRARTERAKLGEGHGDDLLCGCWKATTSATSLLELTGRHIDAVFHLAGQHPAFATSAAVLARAGFESFLRMTWLLQPQSATDREQRWIALQKENERFSRNVGELNEEQLKKRLEELDQLAASAEGAQVPGPPSVESLVAHLGLAPGLYDFYRWHSQATHGTLVGAQTFHMDARFGWNASGGQGEWVEAEFWAMPLITCWEALRVGMPAYRNLLAPTHPLPSLDEDESFHRAIRAIPPNYQARRDSIGGARGSEPTEVSIPRPPNRAERRRAARENNRREARTPDGKGTHRPVSRPHRRPG
ncbi:MAG: DUF5677 domain-containing protein [Humibacillus sp.]|nr:DUF5677 domain-containing protein [Humibacillus sp.]MDN5780014.1 DUF5677 domain-containing protein [Humibacillus sp.]